MQTPRYINPFRQIRIASIEKYYLRIARTGFPHRHITSRRCDQTTDQHAMMDKSNRNYATALALLDTLQSNKTVVTGISKSHGDMNVNAIPEMLDWVSKAGYKVEDFNVLRVVHVAGTKGKGSVCAFVGSILQQYGDTASTASDVPYGPISSGHANQNIASEKKGVGKIGLYTSPHLVTVRERIRINNEPISQSLFAKHFFDLWDRFTRSAAATGHPNPLGAETKPGYFRYLTIMALHVFLQEGIRSAVIECGIGGEYDSTNILTKDAVSVTAITRLGIDHVGMLGGTINEIAWHKGGIMKQSVQCFTVPQETEAMKVLEARAVEKQTELTIVNRILEIDRGNVRIGLGGDFQKENASLAAAVAHTHLTKLGFGDALDGGKLAQEFIKGLEQVKWEGRCEMRTEGNIEWCIDGAHTVESLSMTAEWFGHIVQRSKNVQAMLIFNQQDRDGAALVLALHMALERATGLRHIFAHAAFCTNAAYSTRAPNEEPIADDLRIQRKIADAWSKFEPDTEIEVYSSIAEAVKNAREIAEDNNSLLVLVTGSLHLVGGFLKVLQRDTAIP